MDGLLHDLRYATRKLVSAPAFTLAAVATLAIGIGATTAIFSTVNATLLRPLPFPRSGDLMSLRTTLTDGRPSSGLIALVEISRLNNRNESVMRAAGVTAQPFDATLLRDDGTPVHSVLYGVSEGFFDLFETPVALGRGFRHDDHLPVTQTVPFTLVLSHRTWTTMFGADPNIVGKSLRFAEAGATVIGVANPDFDLPRGADYWFSLRLDPNNVAHVLDGFLRVRPGTRVERLRSELAGVMAELAREFPSTAGARQYVVAPLVNAIVGDLRPMLLIVLAATGLLLVLACVNVTNLLLARGASQMREVAVRTALGAGRGRIMRQLLTESLLLAALGAIAGLFLAYGGVRLLLVLGASQLPRLERVPFDGRVLTFALLVLLVSGLAMGFAPALRLAASDLKALMNESGRTATGGRTTFRLLGGMIVAEVALAIALVTGAGWLIQSFARLRTTDPGFVARGRLVFDVRPSFRRFPTPADVVPWSNDMLERLRRIASVVHAGSSTTFPLRAERDSIQFIHIEGEPVDPNRAAGGRYRRVSQGFFAAMGIRIISGRDFTGDDRQDTTPVAIVNQAFVRRYLRTRNPLGARFAFGYPTVDLRTMRAIVGVVDDVKYKSLSDAAEPAYYFPQAQLPYLQQVVVVETALADPRTLIPAIRDELKRLDPQLALEFEPATDIVGATLTRQQLGMTLMLLFGVTAVTLAAIGIYGVISYVSAQRAGEVATRLALGATSVDVFWLLMRHGLALAAAGVGIGLAVAYMAGRAATTAVYGLEASDATVLATASVVVLVVTSIATAIPARSVAHIDPIRVLRGS